MFMYDAWLSQVEDNWQNLSLLDQLRAKAFGITPENIKQVFEQRSHLLQAIYPEFSNFCTTNLNQSPQQLLPMLWDVWLPLALQIASYRQRQQQPFVQGILGGQGTGKTTLAAILHIILSHLGYRAICLSLDDLYKTYRDRLALKAEDPRLIWRGPPGTHDINLGLMVLDQLRASDPNTPIAIPRFDKYAYQGAGERGTPEVLACADIVLFEGWFVGVRPIEDAAFDTAPPPIITASDRQFARDMNTRLRDYLPLWQRLDRLIVLYPVDYCSSLLWRKQAEQQAIATGKSGMSDAQIDEFVKYFWRSLHPELFIKPLITDSKLVNLVIEINSDHTVGAVYQPSGQIAKPDG